MMELRSEKLRRHGNYTNEIGELKTAPGFLVLSATAQVWNATQNHHQDLNNYTWQNMGGHR